MMKKWLPIVLLTVLALVLIGIKTYSKLRLWNTSQLDFHSIFYSLFDYWFFGSWCGNE